MRRLDDGIFFEMHQLTSRRELFPSVERSRKIAAKGLLQLVGVGHDQR